MHTHAAHAAHRDMAVDFRRFAGQLEPGDQH